MDIKKVILFFNLDNDVSNNSKNLNAKLSYASLYPYVDKNGAILPPKITTLDKVKHFFASFRLYSFIAYCKKLFANSTLQVDDAFNNIESYKKDDLLYTERAIRLFKDYADQNNIELIVYGISLNHSSLIKKSNPVDNIVRNICSKLRIRYYSNINALWQSSMRKGLAPSFGNEGHPNKIGHLLIAEDLKNIIKHKP